MTRLSFTVFLVLLVFPILSYAHTDVDVLNQVNFEVNCKIEYESDINLHGVNELWGKIKNGKGDCDEYAIEKRTELLKRGWHPSRLSLLAVRHGKVGHLVLLVDYKYVLDNQSNEVLSILGMPYYPLKIECDGNWFRVTILNGKLVLTGYTRPPYGWINFSKGDRYVRSISESIERSDGTSSGP